jgi:hypothetical protein
MSCFALLPVLQSHYSGTVAPAVSGSVAELSAASSALLALIRAAEDSITAVLRKSVDTFMTQVTASLQQSVMFLPVISAGMTGSAVAETAWPQIDV